MDNSGADKLILLVQTNRASTQESLQALENLMTEFFDGGTSNNRKREIEELLSNFSQQEDAWRHCMFFMTNSANDYVVMYCCTVIENVITRRWVGFAADHKVEVRATLGQLLSSRHELMPTFLRNKLVKLIVDIGRNDWPHFYPDFLTNTLQLLQQSSKVQLGLVMLRTTSEELASPRDDLSVARKAELHGLLLTHVPAILSSLTGILESILDKQRSMATATPPPSPTHGREAGDPAAVSMSPLQPDVLLLNMFKSRRAAGAPPPCSAPLDAPARQVATLCLDCLAHLLTWVPLAHALSQPLLAAVFRYVPFGFHSGQQGALGGLAMTCVNEALSRPAVPDALQGALLLTCQRGFELLRAAAASEEALAQMHDGYVDRFTDFLRLFVTVHLRRLEARPQFSVPDFLALLFHFTFRQPTNDAFLACLDVWAVLLDHLLAQNEARPAADPVADPITTSVSHCREPLVMLVQEILHKIQFRYNQSRLDELDDESLDDDSETEWQHFLRQCLEIVAKVAELLPADTFTLVCKPFDENISVYLSVEQHVSAAGADGRRHLAVSAENDCRRLHCALRDVATLMQAVGRLTCRFVGHHFLPQFVDAHRIVDRLVKTAAYGTRLTLYEVNSSAGNVLQGDFIELHAQTLAAVKANASWLAQYYTESKADTTQRQTCVEMLTSIVDSVIPLFNKQVPEKIVQSAAHLLLSVCVTVRPAFLLQMTSVLKLYRDISEGCLSDHNSQTLVYRALSHYLLLPWPCLADSDQDWDARSAHHSAFLSQLSQPYRQLHQASSLASDKHLQDLAKPCIKKTLCVMTDLVGSIAHDGVSKSKQMLYVSLEEIIQTTLAILPLYVHQPDVIHEIFMFFLSVCHTLRVQMGVEFTEKTIHTFMNIFTREGDQQYGVSEVVVVSVLQFVSRDRLAGSMLHEGGAGVQAIERFLQILQLIVEEPGASFKAFLPTIISFCMDSVYAVIAQKPSPDVKSALYALLHQLLAHNWRWFFRGGVLAVRQSPLNEHLDHQVQFVSIMQAFGQSFLQPDIAIFKQNLLALQDLDTKWKLFHKRIFRETMLFQFVGVLLQSLITRSHDLLREDTTATLYSMAAVDFDVFFGELLPSFLTSSDGLDSSQKSSLAANFSTHTDVPSFTQNLEQFVSDFRYYRLCNDSLPSGPASF